MDDKLREIEEALSKATPGPWKWISESGCLFPNCGVDYGDYILFIQKSAGVDDADAHLIANAPEWLQWQNDTIKQMSQIKEADKAFYDLTVKQRDRAWREIEQQAETIKRLTEERDELLRMVKTKAQQSLDAETESASLLRQKEDENKRLQSLIRPPAKA